MNNRTDADIDGITYTSIDFLRRRKCHERQQHTQATEQRLPGANCMKLFHVGCHVYFNTDGSPPAFAVSSRVLSTIMDS